MPEREKQEQGSGDEKGVRRPGWRSHPGAMSRGSSLAYSKWTMLVSSLCTTLCVRLGEALLVASRRPCLPLACALCQKNLPTCAIPPAPREMPWAGIGFVAGLPAWNPIHGSGNGLAGGIRTV